MRLFGSHISAVWFRRPATFTCDKFRNLECLWCYLVDFWKRTSTTSFQTFPFVLSKFSHEHRAAFVLEHNLLMPTKEFNSTLARAAAPAATTPILARKLPLSKRAFNSDLTGWAKIFCTSKAHRALKSVIAYENHSGMSRTVQRWRAYQLI